MASFLVTVAILLRMASLNKYTCRFQHYSWYRYTMLFFLILIGLTRLNHTNQSPAVFVTDLIRDTDRIPHLYAHLQIW